MYYKAKNNNHFVNFIVYVKNQFEKYVKLIRSNNRLEFDIKN